MICKKCVMTDRRPRIVFDKEGVCSACRFWEMKEIIDWKAREEELCKLLDKHRRRDGYDVIVPCSGGKDSAYVAHQLKQYGMHPLTVTWAPLIYTDIGLQNFRNFIASGFDNIQANPDESIRRLLARLAFEQIGDHFQPFIYGQMCFPFHIAKNFGIKLVFYGENGEAEYGGDIKDSMKPYRLLEDWNKLYFSSKPIEKLLEGYPIFPDSLTFYKPPEMGDIEMHWFSYYKKWMPQEHYYYACEHTGFQANPERSEGTYSKYASLDDKTDGFHYYMAYVKFGMGRARADASHEIREGIITREEGLKLVEKFDGEFPVKYFKEFLEYLGISGPDFWKVVEKFRPRSDYEVSLC